MSGYLDNESEDFYTPRKAAYITSRPIEEVRLMIKELGIKTRQVVVMDGEDLNNLCKMNISNTPLSDGKLKLLVIEYYLKLTERIEIKEPSISEIISRDLDLYSSFVSNTIEEYMSNNNSVIVGSKMNF